MTTLEQLKSAVNEAKQALAGAESDLADFQERPENNVYASLDDAYELEDVLRGLAAQDCEGAYSVGDDEYSREFMVGDRVYVATLKCEYNRHDKTYYYIEEAEFSIAEKE